MEWRELAPSWQEFHRQQQRRIHVLIVGNDPKVGTVIADAVHAEGFSAQLATGGSAAWSKIRSFPFDLLLIDESLTENGFDLLRQVRIARIPSTLVRSCSKYDEEQLEQALNLGIEDFVISPAIHSIAMRSRLRTILHQRTSELLFEVILGDLRKVVFSGTGESAKFINLSESLLLIRSQLGRHGACAVIDDDEVRRAARVASLIDSGTPCCGLSMSEIPRSFEVEIAPMMALVNMECSDSLSLVADLHKRYPNIPLLASFNQRDWHGAQAAAKAGASDSIFCEEGMKIATRRIRRLAHQSRRQQFYLQAAKALYRAASEVQPGLAATEFFAPVSCAL